MTKHELAILAKLKESGLTLKSDWDKIVECFSETVMPIRNTELAKKMRKECYGEIRSDNPTSNARTERQADC